MLAAALQTCPSLTQQFAEPGATPELQLVGA
jgi:hypothetical protein